MWSRSSDAEGDDEGMALIADKSASIQNWGKASASASAEADMHAPLLALRTNAEKASLSCGVLNRPDTEFYVPIKTNIIPKRLDYTHLNQTPHVKRD